VLDQEPAVIIFAYKRALSLGQLLNSIRDAENFKNYQYFIFLDGPKSNEDLKLVGDVYSIAKRFQSEIGPEKVVIEAQEINLGLANSVIRGVTQVLDRRDKAIVLEDDLVISRKALNYFSRGLEVYSNKKNVGAICGYVPFDMDSQNTTFFINEASSWGWATWSDRWREANWDADWLYHEIINSNRRFYFDQLGTYPFTEMLRLQKDGAIDSWAIRWQASLFLENKLCLYPIKSLITNLGFRGVGTHGTKDHRYEVDVSQDFNPYFNQIPVLEDFSASVALSSFYKKLNHESGIKRKFYKSLITLKKMAKELGKRR
jgi:glycosyltransferase involved in cell wall biosynthesis